MLGSTSRSSITSMMSSARLKGKKKRKAVSCHKRFDTQPRASSVILTGYSNHNACLAQCQTSCTKAKRRSSMGTSDKPKGLKLVMLVSVYKRHLPLAGPTACGHGARKTDDVRHQVPGLDAPQQLKRLLPSISNSHQRKQTRGRADYIGWETIRCKLQVRTFDPTKGERDGIETMSQS